MTTTSKLPNVYVIRADYGRYAHAFQTEGYAAIGWMGEDLGPYLAQDKEALRSLYETYEPEASKMRVAQNVGQIWRFLHDIQPGDFVMTPTRENSTLLVGRVTGDYYYAPDDPACPFPHRKPVDWFPNLLTRSMLSVPTQNTIGSIMAVFQVKQADEILTHYKIDLPAKAKKTVITQEEIERLILDQVLELTADEFEILITELLSAIGFESEHVGKTGDDGIDVTGTLRIYEFASVDLRVQVKRYGRNKINKNAIKHFRSSVPERSQAAFVTTSDFNSSAREEAEKTGFKKIGLINGKLLVGILIEHYDDLSVELKDKLNLQHTLIPI